MKYGYKRAWVLAMAFVIVIAGCGGGDEEVAVESEPEVTTSNEGKSFSMNVKGEDGKTAKIEFGGNEESFTMNIEGGENGVSMQVGESAKIPADFPKDVPVYKGLALNTSHASDDGYMIQGTVTDDIEGVAAFYKAEAAKQGWTEASSFSQAGDDAMTMLSYTKGERTLTVTISRQDGKTSVQIMAQK